MTEHPVPPITEPMGRHWIQPDRSRVLVDETHAVTDQQAFDMLPEYSSTTPSGVYPGKMWKRQDNTGAWWLRWFGIVDGRPDVCSNNCRRLLVA
jgi:hypothetical protein